MMTNKYGILAFSACCCLERKSFYLYHVFISLSHTKFSPKHFSHSVAGAIFSEEQKDTSIELAFKYAVYKINKDRNILPKTTLVYDIQYVPDSTDSFRTSKKVCKSIENGVTAIFGK
jgi:glutamate receptor, ionotropic, invertebrate